MTPAPTAPYRHCKHLIWHRFTKHPCRRMAVKDGYCTQHHPDYAAKKQADRVAKVRAEYDERTRNRAKRERQESATEALAKLGAWVLQQSRDDFGDVDGGSIQDKAIELGLLEAIKVSQPCGELCRCAEYDDFPQTCLRLTPLAILEEAPDGNAHLPSP